MQTAIDPTATPTQGTPVGGYDVRTGRSSSGHRWRWLWTLLLGAGLWIVCIVVTAVTQNTNLLPADILIGSFMIPVAAVAWNFDHRADSYLPMTRIFYAFVVGGTLGVRWAHNGHSVVFSSRNPQSEEMKQLTDRAGAKARAATVREVASASEVILLATVWKARRDALASAGDVRGKILIDAMNPLLGDLSGLGARL